MARGRWLTSGFVGPTFKIFYSPKESSFKNLPCGSHFLSRFLRYLLIIFLDPLRPMHLLCGWWWRWWWWAYFLMQNENFGIGRKFKSEVQVHDINPLWLNSYNQVRLVWTLLQFKEGRSKILVQQVSHFFSYCIISVIVLSFLSKNKNEEYLKRERERYLAGYEKHKTWLPIGFQNVWISIMQGA